MHILCIILKKEQPVWVLAYFDFWEMCNGEGASGVVRGWCLRFVLVVRCVDLCV